MSLCGSIAFWTSSHWAQHSPSCSSTSLQCAHPGLDPQPPLVLLNFLPLELLLLPLCPLCRSIHRWAGTFETGECLSHSHWPGPCVSPPSALLGLRVDSGISFPGAPPGHGSAQTCRELCPAPRGVKLSSKPGYVVSGLPLIRVLSLFSRELLLLTSPHHQPRISGSLF